MLQAEMTRVEEEVQGGKKKAKEEKNSWRWRQRLRPLECFLRDPLPDRSDGDE